MDSYSGLIDYLARNPNSDNPSVPEIQSSSFSGSSRNMQLSYQDAIVVVVKSSKPDLFLTLSVRK